MASLRLDEPRSNTTSRARAVAGKASRAAADSTPIDVATEVLLFIFRQLNASDLLRCSEVCKSWHDAANDVNVWKERCKVDLSSRLGGEGQVLGVGNCKQDYIAATMASRRRALAAKLKRPLAYTGMPDHGKILKDALAIKWILHIEHDDPHRQPTRLVATTVEYAASAVQIQWSKKLDALEDASRISLLASTLLQIGTLGTKSGRGKASQTSQSTNLNRGPASRRASSGAGRASVTAQKPRCRSLLAGQGWNELRKQPWTVVTDDLSLSCFGGWVLGTWQDDGERGAPAFLWFCLHYTGLLERVLKGSEHREHVLTPHKTYFDDCDPTYGLHRYTVVLELRSGNEVLLGERFVEVDVAGPKERDVGGPPPKHGFAKFVLKTAAPTVIAHLPNRLDWSSGGISSTVAASLVDLTVLDEHGKVFIGASLPAPLQPIAESHSAQHGFQHSGGDFYKLVVAEEGFELNLCVVEDPAEHRVTVLSIVMLISYERINRWFGSTHK